MLQSEIPSICYLMKDFFVGGIQNTAENVLFNTFSQAFHERKKMKDFNKVAYNFF